MNRDDEQAIRRIEILHTMEPYVGPGELEKLAEWLVTAGDDDLWITWRRSIKAADMFQQIVNSMRVGRRVLLVAGDDEEIGFTIRDGDYAPRITYADRCQDESVSCCERLRALEAALNCNPMDVSRKDNAFVGERADILENRLRRQTGMPPVEQAMLVHSECLRH